MTPGGDDTRLLALESAFGDFQCQQNARARWRFGIMLLIVMSLYLVGYIHAELISLQSPSDLLAGYPLLFAYMMLVGIIGMALAPMGRRWKWTNPLADNLWLLALLCGGAVLVTLDLTPQNLAGYVIICFPAAVLHSASASRTVAVYGTALIFAFIGILNSSYSPELSTFLFLLTLVIISFTSLYVALSTESNRRAEFLAGYELETLNRTLLSRTEELGRSNKKLEAANASMQAYAAELERLNAELAERSEALKKSERELQELARTDPLTGVPNRRQLFEILDYEFPRARRYEEPLSLAVIDLDDFGRMNKLHGVLAGDEVLIEFAASMRSHVRAADTVARYGGEEFVILMPKSDTAAATQLLERMRRHVVAKPFTARNLQLSFSAGIATLAEGDGDTVSLLNRADEALRRAKAAGKNRVCG